MSKRTVKLCFAHYGEKEEKNCREDCFECPKTIIREEIIFCDKKKAFPCDILCDDVDLCKRVYWGWWEKNRDKRCSLKDDIKDFMSKNKLIFNKRENGRQNNRRTNKNRPTLR